MTRNLEKIQTKDVNDDAKERQISAKVRVIAQSCLRTIDGVIVVKRW